MFMFHIGKLIALQQWPNIQVSHHTDRSSALCYNDL
jgi:hypothetical protein